MFTILYLIRLTRCNSFCTYIVRFLTCMSWHIINYPIIYLLKAFEIDVNDGRVPHWSAVGNVVVVIFP